MTGLQTSSKVLQEAQELQIDTQTKLHQDMESGLSSTLDRLLEVEASSKGIQAAILEATESLAKFTSATAALRNLGNLTSSLIALGFLIFALTQMSKKWSRTVLFIFGQYYPQR